MDHLTQIEKMLTLAENVAEMRSFLAGQIKFHRAALRSPVSLSPHLSQYHTEELAAYVHFAGLLRYHQIK